MAALEFGRYPVWVNVLIFLASAGVVWLAGTRAARYANTIAEQTGLGKAFIGLLLLGGITSLPELAVTVSSALTANAGLAVNNLLGGVAMQVAILSIADAAFGRDALSSVIPKPVVLLQATFGILLLTLVIAGITLGETPLGFTLARARVEVGIWTGAVFASGAAAIWLSHGYERDPTWLPDGRLQGRGESADASAPAAGRAGGAAPTSLRGTLLGVAVAGGAILVAGFLLARSGEALAQQTGLGSSFMGVAFVAVSTSLPEVSTVLAAVRLRQYEMAVADIFGTNLFDIALVFVVDLAYPGGPVLNEVGAFSTIAALLGIAVTTIFLAGLIERQHRTVLRMGWDSLLVLAVYLGGLAMLFRLR